MAIFRVYELEERIKTPNKFRFPSFEAVNWLAAQKLKSDLSDLNSDSTLCPEHLLGGIKSLVITLKSWLQDLDNKPCPNVIDPLRLVRDLNKEVRFAERIQMRCNPPKPERESKRKRLRKELNDDFIDISSKDAFASVTAAANRSPGKKKQVKKASIKVEPPAPSPPAPLPKKIKTKVSTPKKVPKIKEVKKEIKQEPSRIKLKLPSRPIPPTDYDLTDRDSVRQLLSNRNSKLASPPKMKELNSALDDALAGFSDNEDDLVINEEKHRTRLEGPIKLKLKMFGRSQEQSSTPPVKKSNRSTSSNLMDEQMTKVHQDDDYVYPSLDLSDDELDIGRTTGSKDDGAWCPKAKVRGVAASKGERPSRDKAKKVAAVEMGLKMAAERRKKSGKLLPISSPKTAPVVIKSKPLSAGSVLVPSSLSSSLNSKPLSTPVQKASSSSSSSVVKTKKGTAKQRLGKILKLKF